MKNVQNIFNNINLLTKEIKNNRYKQNFYSFGSKKNVVDFIKKDLNLSQEHIKYWWICKALMLAHDNWKKKQFYQQNNISRYPYYYSILYHCWFCKGKIDKNKCIYI